MAEPTWRVLHGECIAEMAKLPEASVHAVVTDPPYGIGFMGREWDTFKPEAGEARIVPNRAIDSDNPNLKGRTRGPASSPSAVEYDYTVAGLRKFQAWTAEWAAAAFRVLKPGGYLVVCGAPRSYHRMACGLEDAGFVIRDKFARLFSTGFPKSLNFGCKCRGNTLPYNHEPAEPEAERNLRSLHDADVPPAVDAGDEPREVLLEGVPEHGVSAHGEAERAGLDAGGEQPSLEGRQLHRAGQGLSDGPDAVTSAGAGERLRVGAHPGSGTDPRPVAEAERGSASPGPGSGEQLACEPARLRLAPGALDDGASERRDRCARCGGLTAARGLGTALKPGHEPIVLAWKPFKGNIAETWIKHGTAALNIEACRLDSAGNHTYDRTAGDRARDQYRTGTTIEGTRRDTDVGRWPANVVLDEEAAALLDEQSGELVSGANPTRRGSDKFRDVFGEFKGQTECEPARGVDVGGASRFYYVAKPSREERDLGTEHLAPRQRDDSRDAEAPGANNPRNRGGQLRGNFHPTVKPIALMRWLIRLVTPPGGTVLDPFTGSGTTGIAARLEQRSFIGCEREAEYVELATSRIRAIAPLFSDEATA